MKSRQKLVRVRITIMPKKLQTRRSISVKGTTYKRLQLLAQQENKAISDIIEALAKARCDAAGIEDIGHADARARAEAEKKLRDAERDGCGGIFSF